ncbi:MAG: hypothetical protein ACREQY_04020, partial [Candidatus Binatia bacterium]
MPQFGESIEIVAVEVPVEVVKDGVAVRGLTRDNFELYEDGQRRELSSFEAIDFGRVPGAPRKRSLETPETLESAIAAPVPAPAERRSLLLLFDFIYS